MRQETKKRRPKSRQWKFPRLSVIKNKLWITAGILAVSLAIVMLIGPKVIELDRYLDEQIERLRARK